MTTDDNSFNSQQFKPVTIRYNKSSAFSASKRLFSIRPLQTDEFLDEKKKNGRIAQQPHVSKHERPTRPALFLSSYCSV